MQPRAATRSLHPSDFHRIDTDDHMQLAHELGRRAFIDNPDCDGIYIGGGQFVHASDERTGVTISSLYSGYWQAHYVGATRLWD